MPLFGIHRQKPRHYLEMARHAWHNRHALPFAWRILRDGVCDGCALGTSGMRDWTLKGPHLCLVRLDLMKLNTAEALDPAALRDVSTLAGQSSKALRALGRLPEPMLRRRGEAGFSVVSWDTALDVAATHIRASDPDRIAFFMTSRGITNETYYAAQKAARFLGTPHVDNAARLCHAASTVAMKGMLGYAASTCSYRDWLHADLIVLFGANVANHQPVTTKYLYHAKKNGAQVAVVNPYREPGLARYWVPSVPTSAVFGTALADHWFDVTTGGDLAFLVGVLKALIAKGGVSRAFVDAHTTGFDVAEAEATATPWEALEAASGMTRARIEAFAELLIARPNAIFVWSMGLTQHVHGVDTVRALVNVGLARALPVRKHGGLVPIRGHSGVQGGAEMGCVPSLDDATRQRFADHWGFAVPDAAGLTTAEMIERSAEGGLDVFWMTGGNFLETVAQEDRSRRALARPRLRVHQDIIVSSAMMADSDGDVLLLPATTRYESPGGGTETSTERRVIFSPEIPGPRVGSARPEWQVFGDLMRRVRPERAAQVGLQSAAAIRSEIARTVPLYRGIDKLSRKGDQFQWEGPRLFHDGRFATHDGRARFASIPLRHLVREPHQFAVSTRRGKQFNSIVTRDVDPLTGLHRDDILANPEDLARLGLGSGMRVVLRSAHGTFAGRLVEGPIKAGNMEVHWPEGNVLLGPDLDPESHEPDYNAIVTVDTAV